MPINSNEKGKRGERAFCKALMDLYGIHGHRSQQYCGSTGDAADVVTDLECHLEVKCVERLNLAEAFDQAKKDSAKSGRTPVVAHKKNRGPWMISMALSDLGKFITDNHHLFIKDKNELSKDSPSHPSPLDTVESDPRSFVFKKTSG
jgi:hypothetical protein